MWVLIGKAQFVVGERDKLQLSLLRYSCGLKCLGIKLCFRHKKC